MALDSGAHRSARNISGGRTTVRRVLYMAAWVGTQHNPIVKACYERLRQAGRPRKVDLVACMRKMLTIVNAMLRSNTPWQAA